MSYKIIVADAELVEKPDEPMALNYRLEILLQNAANPQDITAILLDACEEIGGKFKHLKVKIYLKPKESMNDFNLIKNDLTLHNGYSTSIQVADFINFCYEYSASLANKFLTVHNNTHGNILDATVSGPYDGTVYSEELIASIFHATFNFAKSLMQGENDRHTIFEDGYNKIYKLFSQKRMGIPFYLLNALKESFANRRKSARS